MGDGVTVIEWPERALDLLPVYTMHWRLRVLGVHERILDRLETAPEEAPSFQVEA
jgi:tRNA A37 threonylcarbamoyladenosine biosynthesis protein TsaE